MEKRGHRGQDQLRLVLSPKFSPYFSQHTVTIIYCLCWPCFASKKPYPQSGETKNNQHQLPFRVVYPNRYEMSAWLPSPRPIFQGTTSDASRSLPAEAPDFLGWERSGQCQVYMVTIMLFHPMLSDIWCQMHSLENP